MNVKVFSKIVLWVFIYLGSIGFVLPELFSDKSNVAIIFGMLISLALLYRFITFLPNEKIKSFVKNMFN
jgi:hypothetical protein